MFAQNITRHGGHPEKAGRMRNEEQRNGRENEGGDGRVYEGDFSGETEQRKTFR